jgi:hypothetical protein
LAEAVTVATAEAASQNDGVRAADGTPMAKLGVSIDNAMYNGISGTDVIGNSSGGVKMIRTVFFNTVRQNVIVENNLGEKRNFHILRC